MFLSIVISKYEYLQREFNFSSTLVEDVVNFNSANLQVLISTSDYLDEVFFSMR